MRRPVLLLAAVSLFAVAADQPVVTEAVVVTDPCGDPLETGELVAPERDICEVTFRTTTSEDEPTTLEVAVTVAGDEVAEGSVVEAYWDGATCSYAVVHRRAQPGGVPGVAQAPSPAHTAFELLCNESRSCAVIVLGEPVPLGDVPGTDCATGSIQGPDGLEVVTDGDTLTFHLRFDGVLADFAADHAAGATLGGIGAEASPATTGLEQRASDSTVCATTCHDVRSDRATGTRPFVIG